MCDRPEEVPWKVLAANVWQAIGRYGAEIASSGRMAPPDYLLDAIKAMTGRAQMVDRLAAALDTEERGDALVDVARNAHRAEVENAARLRTAESALGEARREGAREALGRLQEWWADASLHTVTSFTVAQNIAAFRAREYPATPSGEGVMKCAGDCGEWCVGRDNAVCGATPKPEPLVIRADAVAFAVLSASTLPAARSNVERLIQDARRLLAPAQTTTEEKP